MRDVSGVAAYNAPFDIGKVELLYSRHGNCFAIDSVLDVMAMFRDVVSMYKCQKMRLKDAAAYLGINPAAYGDLHDAYTDIRVTYAVFNVLCEEYKKYGRLYRNMGFLLGILFSLILF